MYAHYAYRRNTYIDLGTVQHPSCFACYALAMLSLIRHAPLLLRRSAVNCGLNFLQLAQCYGRGVAVDNFRVDLVWRIGKLVRRACAPVLKLTSLT